MEAAVEEKLAVSYQLSAISWSEVDDRAWLSEKGLFVSTISGFSLTATARTSSSNAGTSGRRCRGRRRLSSARRRFDEARSAAASARCRPHSFPCPDPQEESHRHRLPGE